MANAFDRYRGEASGRIEPTLFDVPDGARVFVLGAEGDTEAHVLSAGDYAEIAQTVDLTSIDLIGANMDSIGVSMNDFVEPAGLLVESDTLGLWNFDRDWSGATVPPGAFDLVGGGVELDGEGDIAQASESYSSSPTFCRNVPNLSTTARIFGANDPMVFVSALNEYTVEWWMNFDADARAAANGGVATGIHPDVARVNTSGAGGLRIFLEGATGAKQWNVAATHWNLAGTPSTQSMPMWPITSNLGWTMCSLVYDSALVGAAKHALYVDGALASNAVGAIAHDPDPATIAGEVQLTDPDLWGGFDQVRISDTAHGAAKVLADYNRCVNAPVSTGAAWLMQVLIGGVVYCERTIAAGESRRWRDFYAPVRSLTGSHSVAVRMSLVEVP